jgi:hypothetical protein
MARIRIRKIGVHTIEYKGKNTPALSRGLWYTAILIEGLSEEQSELHIYFLNGNSDKMIYDSFTAFAEDWDIIKEYEFEIPFRPVKSA